MKIEIPKVPNPSDGDLNTRFQFDGGKTATVAVVGTKRLRVRLKKGPYFAADGQIRKTAVFEKEGSLPGRVPFS